MSLILGSETTLSISFRNSFSIFVNFRGNLVFIEFNKKIDIDSFTKKLSDGEPAQIEDVFPGDTADAIFKALDQDIEWILAFKTKKGPVSLTPAQLQELPTPIIQQYHQQIHQNARDKFQYIYSTYAINEAAKAGKQVNEVLMAFHDFLNSQQALNFFTKASGVPNIKRATCHATYYGPGHFITRHNDVAQYPGEDRLVNFVFSFTKGWNPAWGGYLEFYDESNNISRGFMPRYNIVTASKVPAFHSVSYVTPFSGAPRYSITGWFCGT